MFIQNEQGEILNNTVLQEAVLEAAHRTVPELAIELALPVSPSGERDGQRLGFTDIRFKGRSERFHTLQRNHSQLHDMGVLLSRLNDSHGNYPPLLIIPHMPLKHALQCKEAHLNFLDAAGNMFLRIGSSILFVAGMPRPKAPATDEGFKALATSAGMRILFNLLVSPELINAPYREISLTARVSLGSVSHTLESLASHHFIDGQKRNHRRLVQKTALMDLWASNYPLTLRRKLQAHRFSTTHSEFSADTLPSGSCWSGEEAAYRMIRYMEPQGYTIYSESPMDVIKRYRLRADPQGSVEILDAFWPLDSQQDCAPALLVYADLATSTDPRCLETASLIRSRYLDS